jgi:xylan 1,4-beta-xylosidase
MAWIRGTPVWAVLAGIVVAVPGAAQSAGIRTYANPLDLDYRYNFEQLNRGVSYRSGADPVIINHGGEYFLFATISGGYWHSTDLVEWRFVEPSRWPFEGVVAPAALSVRDTLYLLQSTTVPRPILYSVAPATGRLEFYNRLLPSPPGAMSPYDEQPRVEGGVPPGPWDPALFHDEATDRWYMYWGSSNFYPLFGAELDKERRLVWADSAVVELLRLHPDRHGWERFGQDHRDPRDPFVEGAWMTEHGGRYYLQYGAPGTEYNVYANGTYVGDHPLGPFEYAPYNPVSYKPGGWMTGAGHGNTFRDVHGNYWNTGTGWVGINWNFERRIVLYPAGFDEDGQMYADTRFGDFPHRIPTGRWSDPSELFTGWMLLSYGKPVEATSTRDTFPASNLTDEDPRTYWVASANTAGEGATLDLGALRTVRAVQVNFVDHESDLFATDSTVYTRFRVRASGDGEEWTVIADLADETRDRANAYIELPEPVRARWVRYEHIRSATPHLAISDIRVFGTGDGPPPATPGGIRARREDDPRNAFVEWDSVRGAVGYNVLWGIAPGKLYQTYQVFADRPQPLEIRALTVGQDYWVAVEAFDENGVSEPSAPVRLR